MIHIDRQPFFSIWGLFGWNPGQNCLGRPLACTLPECHLVGALSFFAWCECLCWLPVARRMKLIAWEATELPGFLITVKHCCLISMQSTNQTVAPFFYPLRQISRTSTKRYNSFFICLTRHFYNRWQAAHRQVECPGK